MELMEILNNPDESERKERLQIYEFEKRFCANDSLGTNCSSCKRRGTSKCFDPEKERKEGWKWSR